jgi:hypothetical protein
MKMYECTPGYIQAAESVRPHLLLSIGDEYEVLLASLSKKIFKDVLHVVVPVRFALCTDDEMSGDR